MELTENEKKKIFLKSYQKSVQKEQEILEEIQRLRDDRLFPSTVNDGMPKGSSQSDLSEYAALMDEQIRILKEERLNKARRYTKITNAIKALDNENEQDVLWYRYIKGLKREEVCVKIGYSWQHTHRIHSNALENLKM